jgi:hypothetical protein
MPSQVSPAVWIREGFKMFFPSNKITEKSFSGLRIDQPAYTL